MQPNLQATQISVQAQDMNGAASLCPAFDVDGEDVCETFDQVQSREPYVLNALNICALIFCICNTLDTDFFVRQHLMVPICRHNSLCLFQYVLVF